MKTITSTEAGQNFNALLSFAEKEPITILKKDKSAAVILSLEKYQEFEKLEDILYGKAAELAIQEGFVSDDEAKALLDSL